MAVNTFNRPPGLFSLNKPSARACQDTTVPPPDLAERPAVTFAAGKTPHRNLPDHDR
jgi:hypothetical protein